MEFVCRALCFSVPVLLKAVRSHPDGTVRSHRDAARSRPDTAHNSTVERSERNKSHTNYMLTTCSVPSLCHVQDEHGKMRKIMPLHVMQKLIRL